MQLVQSSIANVNLMKAILGFAWAVDVVMEGQYYLLDFPRRIGYVNTENIQTTFQNEAILKKNFNDICLWRNTITNPEIDVNFIFG